MMLISDADEIAFQQNEIDYHADLKTEELNDVSRDSLNTNDHLPSNCELHDEDVLSSLLPFEARGRFLLVSEPLCPV